MNKPETRLQRKIRHLIEDNFPGCWIRKISGNRFQNVGIPDLLCCIRGVFFAFEVKMPGKDPTAIQSEEMKKIRAAGGITAVVRGTRTVVDFIERKLKERELCQKSESTKKK